MPANPKQKIAVISSTVCDLPEYREWVKDGCLRLDVFPKMMDHLPALDADAIQASIDLVEQAEIYIGIFAHRYGYVPKENNPKQISITEMEYEHAVKRKLPRLIFLMDENHPVKPADFDTGASADKLKAFKCQLQTERVRDTFTTREDLRGKLIHALSALDKEKETGEKPTLDLHPPNIIPKLPAPFIAHPYSLLQTKDVVGRQTELNLLTDWVTTNKQLPAETRVFNLVAIGGMGKSALTWKWFNEIAPKELPELGGRMWWSFYESDAHYENFIIRALAYTAGMAEADARKLDAPAREEMLFQRLDTQPFLIVLDGLERILLAYSRMDAAHLSDDDLDERTANDFAEAHGLPDNIKETYLEKHRLRQCADPRAGRFLRRLTHVRASRVLISTRLYPAELQTSTARPLHGSCPVFLNGLRDDDALNLWRAFGVSGTRQQLLPVFNAFGNYPLLIRALAGEVAEFRDPPGDFDKWRAANPGFNPAAQLDLKNAKTHVLKYALQGLGETQRKVLHSIAAFRMPATWDTLRALLIEQKRDRPTASTTDDGGTVAEARPPRVCADDRALDTVLTELEDRGLMGWDKQANRYDLHPIVRGVVWAALASDAKQGLYRELHTYFDAAPRPPEWQEVESLEELTPAVELFDKLIGLERYEDAFVIFRDHLELATLYRLSASRLRVELVERLFPDGVDAPPRLQTPNHQGRALNALAAAYTLSGEPGRATRFFWRAAEIREREKDAANLGINLVNLSESLRPTGHLWKAEIASRRGLGLSRETKGRFPEEVSLRAIGTIVAARGETVQSPIALRRALANHVSRNEQGEGTVSAVLAQCQLWLGRPQGALPLAQRAWELAHIERVEGDFIRAARLHGQAALGLGDFITAEERLHHALTRGRAVNLVEEELPALTALAELHRQRQQFGPARELLDQVWAPAGRGPYPLWHADALNVLAQIERDQGNREAAIAAATKAYTLAWCDGPPYAYHYGLTNARKHLQALGAPEPKLPPFDDSKFEPMPDVDLNPKDEFWVDPDKLDSP